MQKLRSDLYNAGMSNNSEVLVLADGGSGSVLATPEPTPQFFLNASCLWCARRFTPRTSGGSVQKFCCTGHRQHSGSAARRRTMRAIEVGLLSVDCLKASHTSVHAARGAFRQQYYTLLTGAPWGRRDGRVRSKGALTRHFQSVQPKLVAESRRNAEFTGT
jgi:hypothetical protein